MESYRHRKKLCRNFALGHCPQGDQCRYQHSTSIPSSQSYSAASAMYPVMRAHPGLDMRYVYNPQVINSPYAWAQPPPAVQGLSMSALNWNVQPTYPPAPAPSAPSSENAQFRPLSWRTTLCRHFVKNGGWCPLGNECGYIHDLALAAHAREDVRFPGGLRPPSNNESGPRAGSKHSHCWAYVQGLCRVRDCPYLHPVAVGLFVPHTPCLAWPNCPRGHLCNYKHPEPLAPRVVQMPAPPPFQIQPPTPNLNPVHPGTVQYHGTTYFPVGVPQASAQSSTVSSSPPYSWNFSPLVSSLNSGHSPYSNSSQPFQSPAYETVAALPPSYASGVPRAFADASTDDARSLAGMPLAGPPVVPASADADAVADRGEQQAQGPVHAQTEAQTQAADGLRQETFEDFPYRPPEGVQRAGHAQRLSVALKSKEDADVARGPLLPVSARRESWMGHRARVDPAHRSWPRAPDFLSPRPPLPPSFQMMP